jgi:hypothetical protein
VRQAIKQLHSSMANERRPCFRFLLLFLVTALTRVCVAGSPASVGEDLIDQKIKQPGNFSQMCALPPPVSLDVPMPLYDKVTFREISLSPDDLSALRDRRGDVVLALQKRLPTFDFSKEPPPVAPIKFGQGEMTITSSGINPHQMNSLYYDMIVGLDAVEILPQLMRLEEQLHELLTAAEADPKRLPPWVEDTGSRRNLSPRDQKLFRARIVQRELLSVMLQLLRRQRFESLLQSDLEKMYATALRANIPPGITGPEDAKAQGKEWLQFDPIYHLPVNYVGKITVPYSPKVREQVRGLVGQFLKTVPPKQWQVTHREQ